VATLLHDRNPRLDGLPDLARLVRLRLARPQPTTPPPWAAGSIGRDVLRQLHADHGPVQHSSPFRGSALGKCVRAQAHRWHDTPADGRKLGAKAKARFALGDAAEALLLYALRDAILLCRHHAGRVDGEAWDWLQDDEHPPTADERQLCDAVARWRWTGAGAPGQLWLGAGAPVPVTLDALLSGPDHVRYPVECKSLSSYAITKVQKALARGVEPWDDDESYAWQLNAYLRSTSSPAGYVLGICGDSGVVVGWWQSFSRQRHLQALANTQAVVHSGCPTDVPRVMPDGEPLVPKERKRGKGYELPWQCVYCSFWRTCWASASEGVKRDWRGRPSTTLLLPEDYPEAPVYRSDWRQVLIQGRCQRPGCDALLVDTGSAPTGDGGRWCLPCTTSPAGRGEE